MESSKNAGKKSFSVSEQPTLSHATNAIALPIQKSAVISPSESSLPKPVATTQNNFERLVRQKFIQVANQFNAMRKMIKQHRRDIEMLKSTRLARSPQARSVEEQDFPAIIKDFHQFSAYGNVNHRISSMGQIASVTKKVTKNLFAEKSELASLPNVRARGSWPYHGVPLTGKKGRTDQVCHYPKRWCHLRSAQTRTTRTLSTSCQKIF